MADATIHLVNRSWDYILNGPESPNGPTEKEHQSFIDTRNPNIAKRSTPAQTFSLGGAVVFALGWLFSLKGDNSLAKWTTGILAAVGLGATALFKGWSKDSNDSIFTFLKKIFTGETAEKDCKNKIFGIAAKEIAKHTRENEEDIKKALLNSDSQNSDLLKDVLNIEYIANKKDSSKVDAKVCITFKPTNLGESGKKVSISFEESWDELPAQVRADFLQKGGDTHSRVFYDFNNQKTKPSGNEKQTESGKPENNQGQPVTVSTQPKETDTSTQETDTVEELIAKLKNNRSNATYHLINKNDPSSIPLLIECLSNNYSNLIRNNALHVLREIGDQRVLEPLITCLDDPEVGTAAARALRRIVKGCGLEIKEKEQRERIVKSLIPHLNNREFLGNNSDTAALILGELKDPIAVEPLINSFFGDERASDLRIEIIKALGKIRDPRAVDLLLSIKDPPNSHLLGRSERSVALNALSENDMTFVILINHIINKDELSKRSRHFLKEVFEKDDSSASLITYLTELVKSKNSYVSEQALKGLEKIQN